MKIYQIHKTGGEWEDFYDIIVGSYLSKEKAEKELEVQQNHEQMLRDQSSKCASCPYIDYEIDTPEDLKKQFKAFPDYCKDAKVEITASGNECENYFSLWDQSYFKIEEVEVIE